MERERPRLFLLEASGKELFDRIRYSYRDGEEIKVPKSTTKLKSQMPKISTGEIDVRRSTIPNAGNGVFAQRAFQKNEIITYYDGPVMSGEEAKRLPIKSHHKSIVTGGSKIVVGHLNKDKVPIIDPRQELRDGGVGAFLNDSRNNEKNNVEFLILDMMSNQEIWVKAVINARNGDRSNKLTVRILMPVFDLRIPSVPHFRDIFRINQRIIIVRALRDIEAGEELFVSYGNDYQFFDTEEGRKRGPGDEELREKGEEKRVKIFKKCLSCESKTEYVDRLSQQYMCSPECQETYYENFPELLSFFQSLCQ